MKNIRFGNFLSFSKLLDGKTLKTKARGKEFIFEIDEGEFIYVPLATDNPRYDTYKSLKRVNKGSHLHN